MDKINQIAVELIHGSHCPVAVLSKDIRVDKWILHRDPPIRYGPALDVPAVYCHECAFAYRIQTDTPDSDPVALTYRKWAEARCKTLLESPAWIPLSDGLILHVKIANEVTGRLIDQDLNIDSLDLAALATGRSKRAIILEQDRFLLEED